MNKDFLSLLTQAVKDNIPAFQDQVRFHRLGLISELIKIVLNGDNSKEAQKVFSDCGLSLEKNYEINCKPIISTESKRNIDSNLAVLAKDLIEDFEALYGPYCRAIKKIYRTEARPQTREEKLKAKKDELKQSFLGLESNLFAYCIGGNHEYFSKVDALSSSPSLEELLNLAFKMPTSLVESLIPTDVEIVKELSSRPTLTVEKLANKYSEDLFKKLGFDIGSATYRRELTLKPENQYEIDVSDEQLNDFIAEIKRARDQRFF